MSNLIGWYSEELRGFLASRLPEERVDDIVRESAAHLAEALDHHLGQGLSQTAAEEATVKEFGTPRKVAYTYLRLSGRRLLGRSPAFFTITGALLGIICWNTHWLTLSGYFDNFGDTWQNELCGVFGLIALTLIGLGARTRFRTSGLLLTATTAVAAVLCIPLLSYWMVGGTRDYQGLSRFHLSRDVARIERMLGTASATEAMLVKGMEAYQTPSSLPAEFQDADLAARELGEPRFQPAVLGMTLDPGGKYIVPRVFGSFLFVDGRVYVFETMKDPANAAKAWQTYAAKDLAELQRGEADMRGLLASAKQAQDGRLFFFNYNVYGQGFWGTVFLLPLLLLADLLGSLSALPRRARMRSQTA